MTVACCWLLQCRNPRDEANDSLCKSSQQTIAFYGAHVVVKIPSSHDVRYKCRDTQNTRRSVVPGVLALTLGNIVEGLMAIAWAAVRQARLLKVVRATSAAATPAAVALAAIVIL